MYLETQNSQQLPYNSDEDTNGDHDHGEEKILAN